MRDLLVLLVVYSTIPLAAYRPFLGLLVYMWLAYMRPQDLAWNLGDARLSMMVTVAIFFSLIITLGKERLVTFRVQTFLLAGFSLWLLITSYQAVLPEYAMYWSTTMVKVIAMCILTTGIVRTEKRFRVILIVIAFSIGFLGLKYGLYGLLRGGARFDDGPGGLLKDNNTFALALNMAIPLLVGIALTEKRWLKVVAIVLAMFCVLTIFFTFSRGGFLTLAVCSLLLAMRSKKVMAGAAIVALLLAFLIPLVAGSYVDDYLNRVGSIKSFDQDASAMGRIEAWKTSIRVFQDNKLFGVGPENFPIVRAKYGDPEEKLVAHNTYLQILAENGLPGILLYLGLLVAALIKLQLVVKRTSASWLATYARMIQVSIVAFLVGSTFLNMAYAELIYQLIALSVCCEVINVEAPVPSTAIAKEPKDVEWWRRAIPTG